jgi:hypothetical protein
VAQCVRPASVATPASRRDRQPTHVSIRRSPDRHGYRVRRADASRLECRHSWRSQASALQRPACRFAISGNRKGIGCNTVPRNVTPATRCAHPAGRARVTTTPPAEMVTRPAGSSLSLPSPACAPRATSTPIRRCIRHVAWRLRHPPVPQHHRVPRWLSRHPSRCGWTIPGPPRSAPHCRPGPHGQSCRPETGDSVPRRAQQNCDGRWRNGAAHPSTFLK